MQVKNKPHSRLFRQILYSVWQVDISAQVWQVTQSAVPSQAPPPELEELLDDEEDELLDDEEDELLDDDEDDEEVPDDEEELPLIPPVPPLLLTVPELEELLVPPLAVPLPLPFLPVSASASSNSEPVAHARGRSAKAAKRVAVAVIEKELVRARIVCTPLSMKMPKHSRQFLRL